MTLKFGGELELTDVDIKTSTKEARKLFLELLWEMTPEVVVDLMKLFNIESIPSDWQNHSTYTDYAKRLFMFHTQNHYLYSLELTEYDFQSDVRNTPVLAYFDFIFKNQAEFDELLEESENHWKGMTPHYTELVTGRAIENLIPNWQTLQSKNGSEWLCAELSQWAEKWNLKDDWCLDFALECLKNFKIKLIDQYQLPDNYTQGNDNYSLWELNDFWYDGKAWAYSLRDWDWHDVDNHWFINTLPNYPTLQHIWNVEGEEILRIEGKYNPLIGFPDEFHKRTGKRFWATFFEYFLSRQHLLVENDKLLTDELGRLKNCVNAHISKATSIFKPIAQQTVIKRSGDKHFRWLVEFQILGKSKNTLAKEKNVTRKALTDGIEDASKIVGLTLREPSKGGKTKGAKDLVKRQARRTRNS